MDAGAQQENRWQRLPKWAKWTVGVIAALLLVAIGAAIGEGETGEDSLKEELAVARTHLRDAEDAKEDAEATAEQIVERKEEIIAEAHSRAGKITGSLNQKKSELESTKSELSETEAELSGAEEEKELSTIPGDGTFQAEVDYVPGTYKSEGGPTCYWATLNSPDPYDIASNENASGPTIAPVTTPYFQTKGCGEWERIGE